MSRLAGHARGVLFLVIAAVFAVISIEALSKLWAAYQDSPWWVYATYGGVSGVLAVACLVTGLASLRHR
jgi:hypothetical protein